MPLGLASERLNIAVRELVHRNFPFRLTGQGTVPKCHGNCSHLQAEKILQDTMASFCFALGVKFSAKNCVFLRTPRTPDCDTQEPKRVRGEVVLDTVKLRQLLSSWLCNRHPRPHRTELSPFLRELRFCRSRFQAQWGQLFHSVMPGVPKLDSALAYLVRGGWVSCRASQHTDTWPVRVPWVLHDPTVELSKEAAQQGSRERAL